MKLSALVDRNEEFLETTEVFNADMGQNKPGG
jgi:hypothetical protein